MEESEGDRAGADRLTKLGLRAWALVGITVLVVIVYVSVVGTQDTELREENYVNKIYPQLVAGRLWSAIQVTTAAGEPVDEPSPSAVWSFGRDRFRYPAPGDCSDRSATAVIQSLRQLHAPRPSAGRAIPAAVGA